MHYLPRGLSQHYERYTVRATTWAQKSQISQELSPSWNLYPVVHPSHWFWNLVPWAQTVKHILLFLSTSYGPWWVSKGSLSAAEDYRGSDFPENAGARRTPTMPWVKIWSQRKTEAFCHREPINVRVWIETRISRIWDYGKKQRKGCKESADGSESSFTKPSSTVPGARLHPFPFSCWAITRTCRWKRCGSSSLCTRTDNSRSYFLLCCFSF